LFGGFGGDVLEDFECSVEDEDGFGGLGDDFSVGEAFEASLEAGLLELNLEAVVELVGLARGGEFRGACVDKSAGGLGFCSCCGCAFLGCVFCFLQCFKGVSGFFGFVGAVVVVAGAGAGGDFLRADGAFVVAEFALGALGLELLLASGAVGGVESLKEDFCEFGFAVAVGAEFLFLSSCFGFVEGAACFEVLRRRCRRSGLRLRAGQRVWCREP